MDRYKIQKNKKKYYFNQFINLPTESPVARPLKNTEIIIKVILSPSAYNACGKYHLPASLLHIIHPSYQQ